MDFATAVAMSLRHDPCASKHFTGRARQPTFNSTGSTGYQRMRVCVLGAGIAGLAAAWQLQREGHEVTIIAAHKVVFARIGQRLRSTFDRSADAVPLHASCRRAHPLSE